MVCMADEFATARFKSQEDEKKVMTRCFLKIALYLTTRKYSKTTCDFESEPLAEESVHLSGQMMTSWREDRKNNKFSGIYSEDEFQLYADLLFVASQGMEGSHLIWWDDALRTAYFVYCLQTGRKA